MNRCCRSDVNHASPSIAAKIINGARKAKGYGRVSRGGESPDERHSARPLLARSKTRGAGGRKKADPASGYSAVRALYMCKRQKSQRGGFRRRASLRPAELSA